jgi:hypothetical protein
VRTGNRGPATSDGAFFPRDERSSAEKLIEQCRLIRVEFGLLILVAIRSFRSAATLVFAAIRKARQRGQARSARKKKARARSRSG